MTDQPETAWQALIDDLHAEVDQGHMHVHRIVRAHRPAIEAEARAQGHLAGTDKLLDVTTEAARAVAACEEARASERQRAWERVHEYLLATEPQSTGIGIKHAILGRE